MKRYGSCYCRYSTDKQQQQSIEYQLERIEDFCKKHEIILVDKYIDEASSGSNDQRKEFQRMIEDSEHSKWGYLLVFDLSRLARSVEDQMFYQKILKQRGIMIISVEEKFDSSPEGHLFSIITAGINEYYAKHIAKRSFAGVMPNAKKGLAIGGIPPLGFDVDKNKNYIINNKEAEAVRLIFSKKLEGWSNREIRDYLNEKGYKSKKGKPFSLSIYEILSNRKYIGEYIFNVTSKKKSRGKREDRPKPEDEVIRIPGGMPQIIDTETFEKVQHLIKRSTNNAKLVFKPSKYFLSSMLTCGVCQQKMCGCVSYSKKVRKPNIRYTHVNYGKGECVTKDIPTAYLDNWISKIVILEFMQLNDIQERVKIMNEQITQEKKIIKERMDLIQSKLNENESQLRNQAEHLVKNSFSMFALEDVALIKDQKGKLEREQRELKHRDNLLARITIDKFTSIVQKTRQQFEEANDHESRTRLIRGLISNIIVTNDSIIAYVNYDTITRKLCDFEIEIANIKRDTLMHIWKT